MQHILCFGNLWHGDDGFGIHVCRRLQASLADVSDVRIFEVGLRALDALPLFDNCRQVVLVDALQDDTLPPGTLRCLSAEEIVAEQALCAHGFGVGYLLQSLLACRAVQPSVVFVGAVVEQIRPFADTLSVPLVPAVEAAVTMVEGLLSMTHERIRREVSDA